jgi:hypothetical protein
MQWTSAIVLTLIIIALPQTTHAAVTVKFRPGAAAPCDPNVNRMDSTSTLADIDQYEDTSSFQWALVNESLPATTGLPDDKHAFFDVTSSTNNLPMGAPFNMTLGLRLLSTNGMGGKIYGLDSATGSIFNDNTRTTVNSSPVRYPTHVFMTGSLQGTLRAARGFGSYPTHDLVLSNPEFKQGRFQMFFDADGDLATTADQTLIAKFGTQLKPEPASSLAGTTFLGIEVGSVIVNWDSALPGVFADQNGNEIATGAKDGANNELRLVSPAAPSTALVEVDFRFECASSGACKVLSGNTLRFRLNMTHGSSFVSTIPVSMTPAAALCQTKVVPKDFSDAKCFPFAFCPFPYFGILVLALAALVVVVIVVTVAKKASQKTQ